MKRLLPCLVLVLLFSLAVPAFATSVPDPPQSGEDVLLGTWVFNNTLIGNDITAHVTFICELNEEVTFGTILFSTGDILSYIDIGGGAPWRGMWDSERGWLEGAQAITIIDTSNLTNCDEFASWLMANATKQGVDPPSPGAGEIKLTGKFYGKETPIYQSNYISQDTPFTAGGVAYDGFTVTDEGRTLTYTHASGGAVLAWDELTGWQSDALRRVTVDNQIWSQQSYDVFMEFFTLAPADPDPTDPTTPVTPDPTDPVTPDPTDPVKPDPTDPVKPDPTDPVKPDPTDPVKPDPTDPVKPDPTDPVKPDPTDPVKPDPTDPVTPDPTDPVKPDPTDPVKPDPTDPVKPDPTDPVTPDPSDPSAPAGSDPPEPTETNPIDPLEHEKNESNQTGNDSVSGVISGIPDYSADFQVAIQKFAEAASYNGTEAKLPIPAIKMPAIPGLIPSVTILGAQSLDFGEYVKLIPENIMTLVQSLLTAALIIYCFKELYDTVQYVLTLKGGRGNE